MKFLIPHHLKATLDKVVEHYKDTEFTLYGKSRIIDGNVVLVDVKVPNQRSSGAYTEVDEDAKEEFTNRLCDEREDLKHWNIWMHSHNTMGAHWSGTDLEDMQKYDNGVQPHFFHIVLSTRGWKAAYTAYKPFRVTIKDVDIVYLEPSEQDIKVDPKMFKEIVKIEKTVKKAETKIEDYKAKISELEDNVLGLEEEKEVLENIETPLTKVLKKELKERNKAFAAKRPFKNFFTSEKKLKKEKKKLQKQFDKAIKETIKHKLDCVCKPCFRAIRLRESLMDLEEQLNTTPEEIDEQFDKSVQSLYDDSPLRRGKKKAKFPFNSEK